MSFIDSILERLTLHSKKQDAYYAIEYLKKINPKLDENNYVSYAFLASNPDITDEERNKYLQCMEKLYMSEREEYEKAKQKIKVIEYTDDDLHRQQDNNTDEQLGSIET